MGSTLALPVTYIIEVLTEGVQSLNETEVVAVLGLTLVVLNVNFSEKQRLEAYHKGRRDALSLQPSVHAAPRDENDADTGVQLHVTGASSVLPVATTQDGETGLLQTSAVLDDGRGYNDGGATDLMTTVDKDTAVEQASDPCTELTVS